MESLEKKTSQTFKKYIRDNNGTAFEGKMPIELNVLFTNPYSVGLRFGSLDCYGFDTSDINGIHSYVEFAKIAQGDGNGEPNCILEIDVKGKLTYLIVDVFLLYNTELKAA